MHLFVCLFLAPPNDLNRAIQAWNGSGRVQLLGESDTERLNPTPSVPPGQPPVLSFRYMEGDKRHRFGDLDLVVDDAGH